MEKSNFFEDEQVKTVGYCAIGSRFADLIVNLFGALARNHKKRKNKWKDC